MPAPVKILALSGSLRKGSFNTALARAAAELAGDGVEVEVATLHGVPLYDGDLESEEGIPEAVEALKQRFAGADGVILVTPEYNNGFPGVLKNGIDWLSRPPKDISRVFADRPVALMGATPGSFGTERAQVAWLPVFRTLRMRPWFGGRMMLSKAGDKVEDGTLTDADEREKVATFVAGFAAFIRQCRES